MTGELGATLMSIAVIGTFLLIWGGVRVIRAGDRQKGVLMLVAALVLLANVLVWAVPL